MGCGCGSTRKRQIKKATKKASKLSNNKKPVNNSNSNPKRTNRMVKIKAINKTLSKK